MSTVYSGMTRWKVINQNYSKNLQCKTIFFSGRAGNITFNKTEHQSESKAQVCDCQTWSSRRIFPEGFPSDSYHGCSAGNGCFPATCATILRETKIKRQMQAESRDIEISQLAECKHMTESQYPWWVLEKQEYTSDKFLLQEPQPGSLKWLI